MMNQSETRKYYLASGALSLGSGKGADVFSPVALASAIIFLPLSFSCVQQPERLLKAASESRLENRNAQDTSFRPMSKSVLKRCCDFP